MLAIIPPSFKSLYCLDEIFIQVSLRLPKTPLWHHYDVNSYHCVSKLAYFVEHDIGYQPLKFECSRMSGSNFMEGGGTPPQCYNEMKKPSAYRVKTDANFMHLRVPSVDRRTT